jgi:hypothetical protein
MFLLRLFNKKSFIRYNLPIVLTIEDISHVLCIDLIEAKELVSSGLIKTIPFITKDRVFANRLMEFINLSSDSPNSFEGDYS